MGDLIVTIVLFIVQLINVITFIVMFQRSGRICCWDCQQRIQDFCTIHVRSSRNSWRSLEESADWEMSSRQFDPIPLRKGARLKIEHDNLGTPF